MVSVSLRESSVTKETIPYWRSCESVPTKRASVDRSDQLPDGRVLFAIRLCASTPLELRNFGPTDLPLGQTRTSVLYSRANCEDFFNSRMI